MLLLTTPVQHIAQNPAVECDPRRLRQWLAKLPTGDVQATVHQLLASLKPFNELQLDIKSRLKLLEIYYNAFDTILYGYDELHLRSLTLSHDHRRQLSDDIMWVYLELANGYKSIVKTAYEGGEDNPSQADLQLAIYRGIELITHALIYAFRDHRTPPPLVYLEIHQLYSLAGQYQLANQNISALSGKHRNPNIRHLYQHIMVLIAADAYAYNGSQINELYELLDKYSDACQLLEQLNSDAPTTGFFIDFHEDQGPRSCRKLAINSLSPTQRILKVDGMVQAIVADLNKERHMAMDTIRARELRLLRLFINSLIQGERVHGQRKHQSGRVRVAYAVDACCYYLQHRDRFTDTGVEASNGIEVRDIDIFEAEHELSTWHIVDAIHNGLHLTTDLTEVGHFIVGEMVSVVETLQDGAEPLVSTGLIRWLRQIEDELHMGVEFLPGLPLAVGCQALPDDQDEAIDFTGLYFPSDPGNKQPASLLFEFNQFCYARRFKVDVSGHQYYIEPVKLLNESPVHVQFGFRIINP